MTVEEMERAVEQIREENRAPVTYPASGTYHRGGLVTGVGTMTPFLPFEVVVPNPFEQQWRARPMMRAERLLERMLSSKELARWNRHDSIMVRSKRKPRLVYLIPRYGTIKVLDTAYGDSTVATMCVDPVERLPQADRILALKLLCETQEDELWEKANKYWEKGYRGVLERAKRGLFLWD